MGKRGKGRLEGGGGKGGKGNGGVGGGKGFRVKIESSRTRRRHMRSGKGN